MHRVLQVDLPPEQSLEVYLPPTTQDTKGPFEVSLVLVEPSFLAGVPDTPFDSDSLIPSLVLVMQVFQQLPIDFPERLLCSQCRRIVPQGSSKQEGLLVVQQLIQHCQTFLNISSPSSQPSLFPMIVELLFAVVYPSENVGSDLVVQHSQDNLLRIRWWVPHHDHTSLFGVSHLGPRHTVGIEHELDLVLQTDLGNVLVENGYDLFL